MRHDVKEGRIRSVGCGVRTRRAWPAFWLGAGIVISAVGLPAADLAWRWDASAHPAAVTSSVQCPVAAIESQGLERGVSTHDGTDAQPFDSRVCSTGRVTGVPCLDTTIQRGSFMIIR
jgi:hypothetical protein